MLILLFCILVFILFFKNDSEVLNIKNSEDKIITENNVKNNEILIPVQKEIEINPLLLKKYSKTDFLDKNYVPDFLIAVNKKYLNKDSINFQILEKVNPFLESLLVSSQAENLSLQVLSAYRSFNYQAILKENYIQQVGEEEANKFSADAGFSEHQLGTVIDFTTPEIGGQLSGFEKTREYTYLLANAHKYGFTLSYREDNPYYKFEPWHWRFVGIELATYLQREGKYLDDLSQEEIDVYLNTIFTY